MWRNVPKTSWLSLKGFYVQNSFENTKYLRTLKYLLVEMYNKTTSRKWCTWDPFAFLDFLLKDSYTQENLEKNSQKGRKPSAEPTWPGGIPSTRYTSHDPLLLILLWASSANGPCGGKTSSWALTAKLPSNHACWLEDVLCFDIYLSRPSHER